MKSAHLGNQSCILKDTAGAQLEVGTIVVICTYKTKKIRRIFHVRGDRNHKKFKKTQKNDWSDMSRDQEFAFQVEVEAM